MPKATRQHTTRRTLLASAALVAPAAVLPAAVAGPMVPNGDDPHPAWFAEWRALIDWCNGPRPDAHRELGECWQWRRALELERLAAATPARTLPGALAQLRFARAFVEEYGSLGGGVNDGPLLRGAIATLERLAEEARA